MTTKTAFGWLACCLLAICYHKPLMGQQWTTTGDEKYLLSTAVVQPGPGPVEQALVTIDPRKTYQEVDGFGYTLTGGSAQLISRMTATARKALLEELFGTSGMHISYLRISVGASDLNASVFTYDDVPAGETDPGLAKFSLAADGPSGTGLIPLLKEILSIQPRIMILASPWTAPVWMKDNQQSMGGSLLPKWYGVYARYLAVYIKSMAEQGIHIDAITPQNEPLHGGNNPSMVMKAEEQAVFIRDHLGPVFQREGIRTKIISYDHNCNKPEYPMTVLQDPGARPFVYGSAFHLYEGDISALSVVKKAYPDKQLYFTEQWTGAKGEFDGDLHWHVQNVIIGSMRNWSRTALEWNLANDPFFGPHTPGGCTECKGAITIDGDRWTRNVAYYIIAHASKVVPPGSVRISSEGDGALHHAAFTRPDGKTAVILQNEGKVFIKATLQVNGKQTLQFVPPRAVVSVLL